MPDAQRWISVDDVADHLGVSKDTVYRWIDKRGLPASKVGRFWRFQLSEVDGWVRSGGAGDQPTDPKMGDGR
jgi:excisionase family DNA binding protein